MIRFNRENYCQESEIYYLDHINNDLDEIPQDILKHISDCVHCQKQINNLSENLQDMEHISEFEAENLNKILNELQEHSSYIGKEVRCSNVKPFLPLLACTSLQISALTPITAHIEKCEDCRNNLQTIKEFDLSQENLILLKKLFNKNCNCSEVNKEKIQSFVKLEWDSLTKNDLESLCSQESIQSVYDARAELIEQVKNNDNNDFPCGSVSFEDIFDYCFPVNIDTHTDQYANFRPSLTQHIQRCPKCLFKMQTIASVINDIRLRKNFNISTVFETGDNDEIVLKVLANKDDLKKHKIYENKPIVEPFVSRTNIRLFTKVAAVASILIITGLLFINIHSAGAISLEKLYQNISNVKNVWIKTMYPGSEEVIQEKIISKDLNIYYVKRDDESFEWNMNTGVLNHSKSLTSQQIKISQQQRKLTLKKMSGTMGLMPFDTIADIPDDAEWTEIDDNVYQLKWTLEVANDDIIVNKTVYYLNEKTYLPLKINWLYKNENNNWELIKNLNISYPSKKDIEDIFAESLSGRP